MIALALAASLPAYISETVDRWDGLGVSVTVKAEKCGYDNAWYDFDERSITLCSDLFTRPALARFILNHEMGHAFDHQNGVPSVDDEVAADELAFLMSDEAEVYAGAEWFLDMGGTVSTDEHPADLDRAGSLLCLASARWEKPSVECRVYYRSVLDHWVRWATLLLP